MREWTKMSKTLFKILVLVSKLSCLIYNSIISCDGCYCLKYKQKFCSNASQSWFSMLACYFGEKNGTYSVYNNRQHAFNSRL